MYPKIHENIVVWEDQRNPTNLDIYYIDITKLGAGSVLIPADARYGGLPPDVKVLQVHPDVYERYVVFDECRSDDLSNLDIVLWDLDTDTAIWKTIDPNKQEWSRIDGTRIVWEDSRNGNIDIYTYDITTGEVGPVTTDPSIQFLCDVSGDRIVWTDLRNTTPENPANCDIYMFEREASTPPPSPPTITETQITTNTPDQMYPDIYGDLIVWQDHRNGNADIYLGEIFFAAPPSLSIEQAERIRSIIADPSQIPRSDFDGTNDKVRDNRRNALLNKLDAVIYDIQTAEASTDPSTINTAYQSAIDQLNSMLAKTDGCAERGTPDTGGSGYTPDWIITCESQALIDPLIRDLIATLEALLIP